MFLNAFKSPLQLAEPWNPVIDGSLVTDTLFNMFTKPSGFQLKPLIIGTNAKEMLGIVYMLFTSNVSSAAYFASVTGLFGTNVWTVTNQLPGQDPGSRGVGATLLTK